MNKKILVSCFGAFILSFGGIAKADIVLFDWGFNVDGGITLAGDPIPAGVDDSAFDFGAGLGDILFTFSGAGAHWVDLFLDHEIDEPINSFFNETGAATGVAAAGQSWEIDEPGWVNGDIFENFSASLLDNLIGVSIYGDSAFPDDVSMAMGWDFTLAAGETATIGFSVQTLTRPDTGFFLSHTDPDSDITLFLSSTLMIDGGGGTPIPEPGTLWLLGAGLLGLGIRRRRKQT